MGENIKMSYTGNQAVISSLKNEAASNMEKKLFWHDPFRDAYI